MFSASQGAELSDYGAWLIGLCGGIATQRIKEFLLQFARKKTAQGNAPKKPKKPANKG